MPEQLKSFPTGPCQFWHQARRVALSLALGFMPLPALAQAVSPQPSPVELALDGQYQFLLGFPTNSRFNSEFESRVAPSPRVSDETTSTDSPTLPSLWWSRDQLPRQLGGNRLINSWLAYHIPDPSMKVVDVMVNSQIWGILSYAEQYAVLNQFGTAAKDYGYNLRIFQGSAYSPQILGMYVCDFGQSSQDEATTFLSVAYTTSIPCQASLDLFSIQGMRGTGASLLGR